MLKSKLYNSSKVKTEMLLRKSRKDKGLTIRQVSLELNISESFLSLIEQGKRQPSYELLRHMSHFYGIEIDILQLSVGCIPEPLKVMMLEKPEDIYKATCDKFEKYND
jgi:transcriptional regulator with XRE-family HTH domain